MSPRTRGRKKKKYWVLVNQYLAYVFSGVDISAVPEITAADLEALGIYDLESSSPVVPFVRGANSPKPTRLSKQITVGGRKSSFSTFCSYDKVSSATAAGWTKAKSGRRRGLASSTSSASVRVYIPLVTATGIVNYGFSMNRADFTTYGETLGIKDVSSLSGATELGRLIFGATYPKPGEASLELTDGSTFSSFYDPTLIDDLKEWSVSYAVI